MATADLIQWLLESEEPWTRYRHFPFIYAAPHFREMVETITAQASENGCYTATSMYRAWKGWSFADKKRPSPWLTFLVLRIQRRWEKKSDRGGLPDDPHSRC